MECPNCHAENWNDFRFCGNYVTPLNKGPLKPDEALDIASQVAAGREIKAALRVC